MSPAEKLSRTKTPRKPVSYRKKPWRCQISDERRTLGLSQRDVCAACHITSAALSTIEHGTDPMLTTAYKLAQFFDLPIERLWTLKGEEP